MKSISVLGAGSWGTAIATAAAERGVEVHLWSRNAEHLEEIAKLKENKRYLPGVKIPNNIKLTDDLRAASRSDILACVIPSTGLRHFTEDLLSVGLRKDSVILSCTKGIERSTGLRMTEIIESNLPDNIAAVLSGPNHAEEVGKNWLLLQSLDVKTLKSPKKFSPYFHYLGLEPTQVRMWLE